MLFSPSIKVESFLSTVTIAFKCTAVIYDYVVNLAGLTSLFACSWSSRGQTCTGLRVSELSWPAPRPRPRRERWIQPSVITPTSPGQQWYLSNYRITRQNISDKNICWDESPVRDHTPNTTHIIHHTDITAIVLTPPISSPPIWEMWDTAITTTTTTTQTHHDLHVCCWRLWPRAASSLLPPGNLGSEPVVNLQDLLHLGLRHPPG